MKTLIFAIAVVTVVLASSALGQQRPTDKPEIPAPDSAVFVSTTLTPADKGVKRAVRTNAPAGMRL